MVKVTNSHAKKKLTIAEIFDCNNTCVLEDGRIAFCAWMNAYLFDKVNEKDFPLCFTIDNNGETNIEYIPTHTLATPCDVKIVVDKIVVD